LAHHRGWRFSGVAVDSQGRVELHFDSSTAATYAPAVGRKWGKKYMQVTTTTTQAPTAPPGTQQQPAAASTQPTPPPSPPAKRKRSVVDNEVLAPLREVVAVAASPVVSEAEVAAVDPSHLVDQAALGAVYHMVRGGCVAGSFGFLGEGVVE